MEKINNAKEALVLMKDGYVISETGRDFFVFRNDRIHHYCDGTHFSLTQDDFLRLYEKNSFRYYQETVEIDQEKDEAYYRYYHK